MNKRCLLCGGKYEKKKEKVIEGSITYTEYYLKCDYCGDEFQPKELEEATKRSYKKAKRRLN